MLARLTPTDLSSGQEQRVFSDGDRQTLAEELVSDVLGDNWSHRPDEADWYDVVHDTRGTKVEVKSCLKQVGEKYPGDGRFRLRRDQTRSLTASDRQGTAWYAFVLFDLENREILIRRAKATTVRQWVTDRGGWNKANHGEFDYQHKLPYSVVFKNE